MKRARIIISFRRYSDTDLDNKTQTILAAMKGNKNYPNPTPTLAEIESALKTYSDALVATDGGGRLKIIQKNNARKILEALLRTLGIYVTMVANGDREMLAGCGFDLQSEPSKPNVTAPQAIEIILSTTPGEIEVKVTPVKYFRIFHYEYTLDPVSDNSVWTIEANTSRRHIIKDCNLEKNTGYA